MQNNGLVEANEKLQKELSMLRNVVKEALLEKKKSQTALEALKHQVAPLFCAIHARKDIVCSFTWVSSITKLPEQLLGCVIVGAKTFILQRAVFK